MKKLLITGFEPFGGEAVNPSWEAVDRLPSEINGYSLTKLRIPVLFGGAAEHVLKAADVLHPDGILCIGQAGGRSAITPEMVAINLRYGTIPDNGGYQPMDEPVLPGGASAYFSTAPVRRMVEAVKEIGLPAQVSYSAGAYVCNDVFYTLLARFGGSQTRVGFIHVPYCTEQGKVPAMGMDDIVRGLAACIEQLDT